MAALDAPWSAMLIGGPVVDGRKWFPGMMVAMALPEVRYARSGEVAVAYQVVGDADETIVYAPHLTNLYSLWQGRYAGRILGRLAESNRLIVFNPRGTGLSDRPRNVTLEARMDDVTAVLDAEGLERATLFRSGRKRERVRALRGDIS